MLVFAQAHAQTDPLPSWNDRPAKQAIVEFVRTTTDKASPTFVAPEARIAVFKTVLSDDRAAIGARLSADARSDEIPA